MSVDAYRPGALAGNSGTRRKPGAHWWHPHAAHAAAVWSLAYGALGVYWANGGAGFPFGSGHDPAAHVSVLASVTRTTAAPAIGILGAILTLGLILPWGEIFPRWLPFIGGRRVPRALVVIPAGLVSILVTGAGLTFVRLMLSGAFPLDANWVVGAPMLLWPLWGAALAAATFAYYFRTRGIEGDFR